MDSALLFEFQRYSLFGLFPSGLGYLGDLLFVVGNFLLQVEDVLIELIVGLPYLCSLHLDLPNLPLKTLPLPSQLIVLRLQPNHLPSQLLNIGWVVCDVEYLRLYWVSFTLGL